MNNQPMLLFIVLTHSLFFLKHSLQPQSLSARCSVLFAFTSRQPESFSRPQPIFWRRKTRDEHPQIPYQVPPSRLPKTFATPGYFRIISTCARQE
ncbi:hypothetical protein EV361DRAFT_938026 [Lentinula raphanica]|nr:hypothetical protein EV361DRAFT_938026 [Lentinula raphanica]